MPKQLPLTKVCRKCGQEKPLDAFVSDLSCLFGRKHTCKDCKNARRRERYHADSEYRENEKARSRAVAQENPEQNRQRVREWAIQHHDHVLQRAKDYWHNKVDKAIYNARKRIRRQERYQADEQFRERRKEDSRHSSKIRKYRMKGVKGSYTQAEWDALCARYDYRCVACGAQTELTVDHVLPIAKGGTNDIANLQPLCLTCNLRKGTQHIDYR